MRYAQVLNTIQQWPWAIVPQQLDVIVRIVGDHADGEVDQEEIRTRLAAAAETQGPRAGALGVKGGDAGYVAVLPVYGTLIPRATMMSEISGGVGADQISYAFNAAVQDPQVKAIVLDIDSPGGATFAIPELASEIRAARGQKPIVAVANYLAASAAYWLAAQADEIVASPSAILGSIGTYAVHVDQSGLEEKLGVKTTLISAGKHKLDANPHEPLEGDALARQQAIVDEMYRAFVADVAAGRGVSLAEVEHGYGEGGVVSAQKAVELGMADRIGTLEQTIARVMDSRPARSGSRAEWQATLVSGGFDGYGVFQSQMSASDVVAGVNDAMFSVTAHTGETTGTAGFVYERPDPPSADDRRGVEDPAVETEETIAVSEPVATPAAAQADPARDELLSAVRELTVAVQGQNEGRVDPSTVENLSAEVARLNEELIAATPRTGFVPDDVIVDRRRIGIAELHQLPSRQATQMVGMAVEQIDEFHRVSDNLLLLSAAMKRDPRELRYYGDSFLPVVRGAMDSVTATEGDEFVPTLLSGNLIQRVELALRVVALFPTMDMPSNPYEIPGFGVRTRGGRASENTADTGQTGFRKVTPLTRKITLTAVKFAAEALVSKEAEEDSLIPILDYIRNELTSQLAVDMEDAVINGDTTATHMDSNVTDALDPRKNWNGLRKLAQAGTKTDASNAILTAAMLAVNRKKMGKYGVDSSGIVHIVGIGQYVNMLADANLLTVDKYGPNATILTGELGRVGGIPIVVSEYVQADLNATGVYDGVTTNRSIAITVNPGQFLIGNRRSMTVQLLTELYAEYDQDAIAVTHRKAFAARQVSTDTVLALTYNLAA